MGEAARLSARGQVRSLSLGPARAGTHAARRRSRSARGPSQTRSSDGTFLASPLPGHLDRAPLRLGGPVRSRRRGRALPGHLDRAPLRRSLRRRETQRRVLFPVISTGLHCGDLHLAAALRDAGSSRSSRPGSIAASPHKSSSHNPHASSRSSRPGSIAASVRGRAGCLRAMLFPVISTGLHCGDDTERGWLEGNDLFPVISTGLHCGANADTERPA